MEWCFTTSERPVLHFTPCHSIQFSVDERSHVLAGLGAESRLGERRRRLVVDVPDTANAEKRVIAGVGVDVRNRFLLL